MLIQDCDTFPIKPYTYYKDNKLVFLTSVDGMMPVGLYFNKILNMNPTDHLSFITDIMPISNRLWKKITTHINLVHNDNWFISLYNVLDLMTISPVWGSKTQDIRHNKPKML